MALVFFTVSVLNNAAFSFDISVPIHTIFRSSSLVMNMVIGFLVFQKRYGVGQILCALSINAGLVMLTLTAKAKSEAAGSTTASSATAAGAPTQLLGIGLLCITVVLSALLGLLQDNVFRIGRSSRGSSAVDPAPIWAESMFFCHVLCLPFFFLTPQTPQRFYRFFGTFETFFALLPSISPFLPAGGDAPTKV